MSGRPMSKAHGTGLVGTGRRERGREAGTEVVRRAGVDGKRVSGPSGSPRKAAVAACGMAEKEVTPRVF